MRSFIIALLFITYIAAEVSAISSEGSAVGAMDNNTTTSSKRRLTRKRIITLGGPSFGTWGNEFKCDPGKYINKFNIMSKFPTLYSPSYTDARDELGVQGLTVSCTDGKEGTSKKYVNDYKFKENLNHADWLKCNGDNVVIGFNVQYVPKQGAPNFGGRSGSGNYDDAAIIDINMFCSDGKQLIGGAAPNANRRWSDAKWDEKCKDGSPKRCSCAPRTSLCGIRTQVEDRIPQKTGWFTTLVDNTALDKIQFICCQNR